MEFPRGNKHVTPWDSMEYPRKTSRLFPMEIPWGIKPGPHFCRKDRLVSLHTPQFSTCDTASFTLPRFFDVCISTVPETEGSRFATRPFTDRISCLVVGTSAQRHRADTNRTCPRRTSQRCVMSDIYLSNRPRDSDIHRRNPNWRRR